MIYGKKIVSLCTSRIHDIENFRGISEFARKLAERNIALFIYDITADLYWEETSGYQPETAVFDLIDFSVTDVLIIMHEKIKSKKVSDELVMCAGENNVPVIMVDSVSEGCCNICVDYKSAFEQVVRHVIEHHGAKNPHFLAGIKDNVFSDDRMEVFRKVIEENGIPFTSDRVSYGDFWAAPAREAMEKLVESGNIPDAVICANDIMAINAMTVFMEHDYKVPEDIIITGFDGIDEINFSSPKITSVSCGTSCFTESIFSEICNIFENGFSPKNIYVHPEMLINGSCGCCDSPDLSGIDLLRSFNDRFYRMQDDNIQLAQMTEKMLSANEFWEVASLMFNDVIKDAVLILDKKCTDINADYFSIPRKLEDEMFLLFDNLNPCFELRPFMQKDMIPGLEDAVNSGYPLIFNIVSFMEKPIGYLCFCFKEYDVVNYIKIPQIVNYLGYGIGGYITMRYQNYLNQRISQVYQFDYLTGLYTRRAFMNEFDKNKVTRSGSRMTVVMTDLDGLKQINDKYGHADGDNAIRALAAALACSCPADALTVRLGGDELLAIVFGEYEPEDIKKNITTYLEYINSTGELQYKITASVGCCQSIINENTDFESLVRTADISLYQEKMAKKGNA